MKLKHKRWDFDFDLIYKYRVANKYQVTSKIEMNFDWFFDFAIKFSVFSLIDVEIYFTPLNCKSSSEFYVQKIYQKPKTFSPTKSTLHAHILPTKSTLNVPILPTKSTLHVTILGKDRHVDVGGSWYT